MTTALASAAPEYTTSSVGEETIAIKGRQPATSPVAKDVANYVADMILELRNISKSAKLYKVMVPLEFAYYEAFHAANNVSVPKSELERLQHLGEIGAALNASSAEPEEAAAAG